jgi:hypothetical protein
MRKNVGDEETREREQNKDLVNAKKKQKKTVVDTFAHTTDLEVTLERK